MKEILFRGKTELGKWVYGSLVIAKDYNDITAIFPVDVHLYSHGETDGWEEVIPETVGQYTGLMDRNGRRIFEGDILESVIRRVGKGPVHRILVEDIRSCKQLALYVSQYEIAGNIHDNPELWEVKYEG